MVQKTASASGRSDQLSPGKSLNTGRKLQSSANEIRRQHYNYSKSHMDGVPGQDQSHLNLELVVQVQRLFKVLLKAKNISVGIRRQINDIQNQFNLADIEKNAGAFLNNNRQTQHDINAELQLCDSKKRARSKTPSTNVIGTHPSKFNKNIKATSEQSQELLRKNF